MHISSQIGEQQQNMKQFQIMLVQHPQIGPFYEAIWQSAGKPRTYNLKILNVSY